MRDREEQIRNGMSFGEEQQLYWNKEDYLNEEEIPIELYVKRNGETIKFVRFEEIERLNKIISGIEQYIKYYVMNNFKFDNNTADVILYQLEKLKDSDKEKQCTNY